LKVVSLLRKKDDISLEESRNWALNEHPERAKPCPGCVITG